MAVVEDEKEAARLLVLAAAAIADRAEGGSASRTKPGRATRARSDVRTGRSARPTKAPRAGGLSLSAPLGGEPPDLLDGPRQRGLAEDVRGRIGDVVERRVELVAAG